METTNCPNEKRIRVVEPTSAASGLQPGTAEMGPSHAVADVATLTGTGGLLGVLVKEFIETALDVEMHDHLGYVSHAREGRNGLNSRNGKRTKLVKSDLIGEVMIDVPRDRNSTFLPVIVEKRQVKIDGIDRLVLASYLRRPTAEQLARRLAPKYRINAKIELVEKVSSALVSLVGKFWSRRLDQSYEILIISEVFIDDHRSTNARSPIYLATGIDRLGQAAVLGLWLRPDSADSTEFLSAILRSLKHRGIDEVIRFSCSGWAPTCADALASTWPSAVFEPP